jgi:phospholipid/cholesterol/gamma-HCH transport system ATP-binding protein
MNEEPIIRLHNLVARYGETTILERVSLTVREGEIFVIVGGSGCGKSTLLRHIIGLDPAAAGRIVIDGVDITACGTEAFQKTLRKIGILFQGAALFGSMTVAENVALTIEEYTRLPKSAVDRMVRMKLHLVDLSGFEHHHPSELSGGMKKRAGLARALALNPKILFLDEPSAGLDPVTSAEIDELILRINRTIGTTIVIVTHELDSIYRVAQRIVMLDKSVKGIIAEGDPVSMRENTEHPLVQRFFHREPRTSNGNRN